MHIPEANHIIQTQFHGGSVSLPDNQDNIKQYEQTIAQLKDELQVRLAIHITLLLIKNWYNWGKPLFSRVMRASQIVYHITTFFRAIR